MLTRFLPFFTLVVLLFLSRHAALGQENDDDMNNQESTDSLSSANEEMIDPYIRVQFTIKSKGKPEKLTKRFFIVAADTALYNYWKRSTEDFAKKQQGALQRLSTGKQSDVSYSLVSLPDDGGGSGGGGAPACTVEKPAVSGKCRFGAGIVILTASTSSDYKIYWYTSPSASVPFAEGSLIEVDVNSTRTYYCSAYNEGCELETKRYEVKVNIYDSNQPKILSQSANTCGAKTISFDRAPAGVSYYWQGTNAASTSTGDQVAGEYVVATSGTYYVRARGAEGCWSNSKSISTVVGPEVLTLTAYDPTQPLVQATQRIVMRPGFRASASASQAFKARIAITSECNDYLNWEEQIVYNQNGQPLSRGKVYYDGLGNVLQSQNMDYQTGKVWASQPLYDSYNTPVGATLPAPITEFDFIYKKDFVRNEAGQAYSAADFDVRTGTAQGTVNNPKPVGKQPGTLGWYYSSSNTLEPATPRTDFPYSRDFAEEGPDPTSAKSAGAGNQFRMGSGHEVLSERQKISTELNHYYSIRSHFIAAPNNLSVPAKPGYKFIMTDPNGKKAVSFVDADGQELASATLSGTTYDNWSYIFYNDMGQAVASVAPNGVNTASTAKPQFVTYYHYDHLGQLIETTSPDEGTDRYVYNTDGQIRFSENQLQRDANPKRFSYSNYDYLGRLIEIGEYTCSGTNPYVFQPHTTVSPSTYSVLTIVDNTGFTGASRKNTAQANRCSDYLFVAYDYPAADFPSDTYHPAQKVSFGDVAATENENAKTWYSYDEFGQAEWTKQNISGMGHKTVDYSYDYLGNVTEVAYQKGQGDAFYHHYTYDVNQRLSQVHTSINGTSKTLQAKYLYYQHGPLKRVELAGNKQGIDYVYNIDGTLKMINHADPAQDPGRDGLSGGNAGFMADVFGEVLDYHVGDYSGGINAGTMTLSSTFPDQYNGAVKAIRWHSQVDSHQPRAYAYNYDDLYQLKDANFGSVTGSGGSYGFTQSTAYKESVGQYDKNGNIKSLERKGKTGNNMASYSYNYTANTNKLGNVAHNGSTKASYVYNAIGQLTRQTEGSKVMNISYNAYGLVKEIRNGSNQLMESLAYDDRGGCVQRTMYDNGTAVHRSYQVHDASGSVLATYEQAMPSGAIVQTEVPIYGAGRVAVRKPQVNTTFYEVSDHLGSVRGVIGVSETETARATLEAANLAVEQGQFLRYENAKRIQSALFDRTNGTASGYAQRLSGTANEKYGLAKSLSVMPGDKVSMEVYAKYVDPNSSNWTPALSGLLASIASGTAPVGTVLDGVAYSASTSSFPFAGLLNTAASTGAGPKAYLNWLVFDRNYALTNGGYLRLSDVPKERGQDVAHERLASELSITEPGYVYIYLSNEEQTALEVYFDDFKVTHEHSVIVAGADFYPFGLAMEGREITKEAYRYGYQGQYAEKDTVTGWNRFELRMYNSDIGRWISPDPYGQFSSPYVGMGNMPHMGVDPDGGFVNPALVPFMYMAGGAMVGGITAAIMGENVYAGAGIGAMAGLAAYGATKINFGSVGKSVGNAGSFLLENSGPLVASTRAVASLPPASKRFNHIKNPTVRRILKLIGEFWGDEPMMPGFGTISGPSRKIGGGIVKNLLKGNKGGEKAIVIGEGMYRVKPAAQSVGAKWYQAWSKNFPSGRLMTDIELNAAKARNTRWLNSKIKQGYKIYDIGPKGTNITSPFYQLERDIIQKTGYPTTPLLGF